MDQGRGLERVAAILEAQVGFGHAAKLEIDDGDEAVEGVLFAGGPAVEESGDFSLLQLRWYLGCSSPGAAAVRYRCGRIGGCPPVPVRRHKTAERPAQANGPWLAI